jgi:hypothetical protein
MQVVKIEVPELDAVSSSKAEQIKAAFQPMVHMLSEFEEAFNEVVKESQTGITEETQVKAKKLRINIGKVRIEAGKRKDKAKEYLKLEDKAIMGVHNILVYAVKEKEDRLKEIETYFETQEKLRLEALQNQRAERLLKYVPDAYSRELSKLADDEFEALLQMKKREHEEQLEAMRIAEEQRVAKEKENERIRLENDRLRKEAEETQRKLDEKIKWEREVKEREWARVQAELQMGDSDKVSRLIEDLNSVKTKYTFESQSNKKMYQDVCLLIDKIIKHIKQ